MEFKALPHDPCDTNLAQRLRDLRRNNGWSQQELADRAGLHKRTIYNIETGKQLNPLEDTRIRLCKALNVSYQDLFHHHPPQKRSPLLLPSIFLLALFAIVAMSAAFLGAPAPPTAKIVAGSLVAYSGDGKEVWSFAPDAEVFFTKPGPWDHKTLLVGLGAEGDDAGKLILLDQNSGEVIWERGIDTGQVLRSFGPNSLNGAGFQCINSHFPDLDGDGEQEIVAEFMHNKWSPHVLLFIRRSGQILGQYNHRGHIYDALVGDFDRDERDEILFSAVNHVVNSGALLMFDDSYHSGTSGQADHWFDMPDSSAIRVVFGALDPDFLNCIKKPRMKADHLQSYVAPDGRYCISVDISATDQGGIVVCLNNKLEPISATINDYFCLEFIGCTQVLTQNFQGDMQEYLDWWLGKARRYEVGQSGS